MDDAEPQQRRRRCALRRRELLGRTMLVRGDAAVEGIDAALRRSVG